MFIPGITIAMIQARMTKAWSRANIAWQHGWIKQCQQFQAEYDYLSHYMTSNRVNQILESCK